LMWDWGDGEYSDWLNNPEASHSWSTEDNFEVRVKAMDEHGAESEWSDPLVFSTPRNKIIDISIIERLLYRFPILEFLF